jgi:hypothetical protein
MCDLQILTGFAIIISGFARAFSPLKPLSIYYWLLVVDLAWFSAITHLAGLSILRTYFDHRRWIKLVRVGLMSILLILLILAFIPTGFFSWEHGRVILGAQLPAVYLFDVAKAADLWDYETPSTVYEGVPVTGSVCMQAMIMTVILLVIGFTSRCIKLFRPLSTLVSKYVRRPLRQSFWKMLHKLLYLSNQTHTGHPAGTVPKSIRHRLLHLLVTVPVLSVFLTLRFFADLLSSMLAEVR